MAKDTICRNCQTVGKPRKSMPGNPAIEIALWLCFIIPGLVYSMWRRSKAKVECAKCGRDDTLLPLKSPMGQQLLSRAESQAPVPDAGAPSINLVPTPELCVSMWPRLFGIEPPSATTHEEYQSWATTALVAVVLDLRNRGAITLSQETEEEHRGKPKTTTTIGFADLSGDFGGVAAILLENERAKPGMNVQQFFEGLPLGKRNPCGLMNLVWELGIDRGFYTKEVSGVMRNALYTPVPDALASTEAAAQESAERYKSFASSEPDMQRAVRSAAQLAIPIPIEIDRDE